MASLALGWFAYWPGYAEAQWNTTDCPGQILVTALMAWTLNRKDASSSDPKGSSSLAESQMTKSSVFKFCDVSVKQPTPIRRRHSHHTPQKEPLEQ